MAVIPDLLRVTLGASVTLRHLVEAADPTTGDPVPTDDPGIQLLIMAPNGDVTTWTVQANEIVHDGPGSYHAVYLPDQLGVWTWRWVAADVKDAGEGQFEVWSIYVPDGTPPDLTDLRVLVPRAIRACEGPYGAPDGKPPLTDDVVYPMVADACGSIILQTGSVFGHTLNVTKRDPIVGYPTAWATDVALNEWEGAVIICQVALDYWRFLVRDLKNSQSIKNEGTEWQYSISTNVLRDYLTYLQQERDNALKGIRYHNPVLDHYASNIRVRDQATVAILEWWDNVSPGVGGAGMPGGQEAAVIPWTPGWSGPGFTIGY
jgi:hypothetical protein